MFYNTPSNNNAMVSSYFQQSYNSPQATHAVEKAFSSIEDSQSVQQLQYDGEDLFFNHHELPSHHNEDSYFGSHISCDQFHDQEDEDFHGFFPIDFNQQPSQQLSWNTPSQQPTPIAALLNEQCKFAPSPFNGSVQYNNNSNYINRASSSSAHTVVPSVQVPSSACANQTYTYNNIKQQNNIVSYCQQQQQKQYQNYQQQQSQQLGNASAASAAVQLINSSYSNGNQVSQQFQNSSSSSTFSSQSCSTLFSSQQKSVQYVAPSPVNYYKLYENNNSVNQQNQVKGNNGNHRQNLQPSQQMMCQQGQSVPIYQASQKQQSQQQTFYQTYQQPSTYCQQQQVPFFTQQQSSEEYSYCDNQASSILNFTENGCDETTSDMHFNDDHHTLPIYSYAPQIPDNCNNAPENEEKIFEFFGHNNQEEQEEQQQQQQQCNNQYPQQLFQQQQQYVYAQTSICQESMNQQQNNSLPSMSSSHTLPISPCEEQKHSSEDEEHESMNHHDDDDEEGDLSTNNKVVSMQLIADNPDFYTEQRKEEITESMQKSNKKNVVRNLMRAFKQYFLNRKTSEQIIRCFFPNQNGKDVQQKFKRYFGQRKFNHHSIKQLVQHEKYGVVFHQFLKEHSQAYLKNSCVKMQELHQVFIDFLLLCFKDIDLLDHLETYSKIKNPFQ